MRITLSISFLLLFGCSAAWSQQSDEELAKKLANPIASLISVPFQNNTDLGIGSLEGSRNTLNIQPVIPIKLNEKTNLITRVIMPVISQYNITGAGEKQNGMADWVASAFFSPSISKNGVTWGAGPVLLLPFATNDVLASKQLGIGPTAVALKQSGPITYGALVNQIWGMAAPDDRPKVNQFFFQPFFTYNWKSGAGVGANIEWTENWTSGSSTIWLNPTVSGLTSLGKQKMSLAIGPRINLAAPDGARATVGIRAAVVLLFPK